MRASPRLRRRAPAARLPAHLRPSPRGGRRAAAGAGGAADAPLRPYRIRARRRRALRARADRLPAPCVRGACLARMLKTCRASCSWKAAGTHGKQAQHTHGLASRTATLPALPVVTPLTLTPQVIFCSDEHLHGNVFPDSLEPSVTPGLALLRLVPYARKGRQRSYSESCQRVCFYTGTCCEQASTPFHGQSSTTALSGSAPCRY